ncbi:MAG TPA: type I DNA topoisomerase [Candidatus Limnocylindrales bacterium]|nr:type I DNA topoisomerase [Candidatus Limnocylindrales bacterium]
MKNLVIVESPTKAKTISKFLGKDYEIRFSMGHVMDLPKSKLSIDVANNFTPLYEVIHDKKSLIAELKKLSKSADVIILATDPDREGEAIASHIATALRASSKSGDIDKKFKRIAFHEITESAIKEAIEHPRDVDVNLVDAQTARRVLDRLVGYELSPILWRKVRRGLSAGRVQSVALRLIAEREREIEKFSKSNYWTVHVLLANKLGIRSAGSGQATEFDLIEINNKKIESTEKSILYVGEYTVSKTTIDSEKKAHEVVQDLKSKEFAVSDVTRKQVKRSPLPPFTTSTLQQEASRRFGFSGKRTMSLAQKLYEEGFITYHRTDSTAISTQAISQMRTHIDKEFGKKYLPEKARSFSGKQKNAQEAHEGIRPTKVENGNSAVELSLGKDYAKLYELIWRRALASQMADAQIESTSVIVDSAGEGSNTYRLKANGSVLIFDGFLKLNPLALKDNQLPKFESGEKLELKTVRTDPHETLPPPRYNDASLIGILEEKGIGRPSTYASIISTLTDRAYVERLEKKFVPTPIGFSVNDFLVTNFSTIDDVPFTASMEEQLDDVASGKTDWVKMMKAFYTPFEKAIGEAGDAERVAIATEETDEKCPECGKPLIIRHGKFGKFLSCSGFPDCKFTKTLVEQTNILCPKDGGKVIVRKTRKGRKFYGCENYPACTFAAWKLEDIKNSAEAKEKKTAISTK